MIEALLFIIGLLLGAAILFLISQKRIALLVKERNHLFSEAAVRSSEVSMLKDQMTEERRHIEEMQQKNDEQFAQRLSLVQEQLKSTTEILLRQRSEELDKTNMAQMGTILTPLREVIKEMKNSM
ncbi:MAG: hypothetical protein J6Z18_06990, partial [Prevotella sp.]|nr:hypothetical protein [Prevotella sp.]